MKTIRANTFETNSSSTHSMIILTEEEYDKLESGELYLDDDEVITKEEAKNIFLKHMNEDKYIYDDDLSFEENVKNYLDEFEYYPCEYPQSLKTWKEEDELESDTNIYISPSGDKLKIICKYGYIG